MQASINTMQQQMACMAVNPTSPVQQQQQPTPQQQQQPPRVYGGRGNYRNRNNFYGGRNSTYGGRRGRGGCRRGYRNPYNQGQQQVPGFTPAPSIF
eukprot:15336432-Ditylum_brightwellii.AAC.1